MDVNKMSEKELNELRKQISERENVLINEKADKEVEKQKKLLDALINSNLLDHIEHSRTSCSDENPTNGYESDRGYARCTKCHLMEIIENHEYGIHEFSVHIDFSFNQIQRKK